ncbi:hypothetical protein GCM10027048_42440 [Hymenobacter coalescens]
MRYPCLLLLLALLTSGTVRGQGAKAACACPPNEFAGTVADTAFHLASGRTLVLCGYRNEDSRPASFSEFVLAACGQQRIVGFWGSLLTCRLAVAGDTLLVQQLERLPTGPNFDFRETVWATERVYFVGDKAVRTFAVNRQLPRYSRQQIRAATTAYETAPKGPGKMELAHTLFLATISGSSAARQYFTAFKTRFGVLDGHDKEEYQKLAAMLALWDRSPASAAR